MLFRNTIKAQHVLVFLLATVLSDIVSSNNDKLNEFIIDQIAHFNKHKHLLLNIRPETTMSCESIQIHEQNEKNSFDLAAIRKSKNRSRYPLENLTLYNALWKSGLIRLSKLDKVGEAILDLSKRLSINPLKIKVSSAKSVRWGNGSAGCPTKGNYYTMLLESGYRIKLRYKWKSYNYHGFYNGSPFLCKNPKSIGLESYPYKPGCKISLNKTGLEHNIDSDQHGIKVFIPGIKVTSQSISGVLHPEDSDESKRNPGKLTYQYKFYSNKLSHNLKIEFPSDIQVRNSYILYSSSQEKYLAATSKKEHALKLEIEYLKKKYSNVADRLFELSRDKTCVQASDCSAQLISGDCEGSIQYVVYSKISTERNTIEKILEEAKQINSGVEENKEKLLNLKRTSVIQIGNVCHVDDSPTAVCVENQCQMDK